MLTQHISSGYARVNRLRPCRICGKPDWCSYTRDEQVSICMRVRDGARRINGQGGAVFVHNGAEIFSVLPRPADRVPQAPLAPAQVRDFVYRALIRLSPALHFPRLLIEGAKGLRARGFSPEHWHNYGALPARRAERDQLARRLLNEVQENFLEHRSLQGVPGFWRDEEGWHLWTRADYRYPRLLIPCRDSSGLIQGCQMRAVGTGKKSRYLWLSSSGLPNGAGSGSPLHFTFRENDLPSDGDIFIVEGVLKADALVALRSQVFAIAAAGVTVAQDAVIKATRERRIVVAFDRDYLSNEAVCLALTGLLARRKTSEGSLVTTRIAVWPRQYKGIDDATAQRAPITTIGIGDWFRQLPVSFQRKVFSTLG